MQAWQTVRIWLMSHKKGGKLQLPKLSALLGEGKETEAQTPAQMAAAMREIAKQHQGKIRIREKAQS